jgi:hypothetical protein
MPGMKSGLSDTNPVIVAAFKAALQQTVRVAIPYGSSS